MDSRGLSQQQGLETVAGFSHTVMYGKSDVIVDVVGYTGG